jgi:hypothetical protein
LNLLGQAICSDDADRAAKSDSLDEALPTLPRTSTLVPADTLDESLLRLPRAPTLAPVLGDKGGAEATAISNTSAENGETEIVNILEAIPGGSAITFAISNLGDCLAGAPIVPGADSCRTVERLAQACNCSFILHENAGTITFYSNEGQDALGIESD